jgi:plasmid stabilization system protein ParE
MAGDSGRRLLDMAKELFLSDQLVETGEQLPAPARVVRGRYELRALVDRLAISLGEEIIAIADHVVVELERGNPVAAADLADRLEVTTRTALANAQQVSRSELRAVTLIDVQCTLRDPDLVTGARRVIRESVAAALQLIATSEHNGDRRKGVLDEVCTRFTALLGSALDSVPWQHRDARDELHAFLCSFADLESPSPEQIEIPFDESIQWLYEINKPFVPVQILLRSRVHTTNVFEVANRPSLCKLHVLWFLAGLPRGLATAEHLVTALRALEHSDGEILETINQFVVQDMRLIWFDRSFAYPSIAALLANPDHRAVMSRAGWSYQSALTSEIDYLLVKLGRANLGLTTQINDVVLGLRELHELEIGIRDRAARGVRIPEEVFTAVHDIVVRAALQFTDLAARHFRKLSRNVERDELRQSVVTYERLLTDVASLATGGGSGGTVPRAALRCIDPYEVRHTPVHAGPMLAELRKALAGNRFWVDGMTADEHRAMADT